jgi:predicted nuclease of predicted toxin-antitoxin system
MNISPALAPALQVGGHQAIHWSSVGDPRAQDPVVLEWARENGFVLITNDLGFGAILAAQAIAHQASCKFARKISHLHISLRFF